MTEVDASPVDATSGTGHLTVNREQSRVDHLVGVRVDAARFDGRARVFASRARGVLRCSAGLSPAVDIRCLTAPLVCRGGCSARVRVPLFDECEPRVADLRHRYTETKADGAAALLPVAGGRAATTRAASRRA